jgi:DNA-binding PadR family transcriptional regulator
LGINAKRGLKLNLEERSLKAFLDLAILCALNGKPLSGYELSCFFAKNHRILINSSMVYYKLYSIERKGWIIASKERSGNVYRLTEQGQIIVDNIKKTVEENTNFMRSILDPIKKREITQ